MTQTSWHAHLLSIHHHPVVDICQMWLYYTVSIHVVECRSYIFQKTPNPKKLELNKNWCINQTLTQKSRSEPNSGFGESLHYDYTEKNQAYKRPINFHQDPF